MAKKKQPVDDFTTTDMIRNIIDGKIRFKAKNVPQKEFSRLINENEIVICSGPAGTGKSFVSIARALELIHNTSNNYEKIIIYKPAVEVEEKHGFLPGDLQDKIMPYVESSLAIIDKIIGRAKRERLMMDGIIEIKALAYTRGANVDKTILIMEEAQNMSANQMKTLLTRIGENSKFIISGDMDQSDKYKNIKESGLYDAMNRLPGVPGIGFFTFGVDDIVRNPIISKILNRYKVPEKEEKVTKKKLLTETVKPVKKEKWTFSKFFTW